MVAKQKAARATTFLEHLKQVLEMFDKPEQLGLQSPLAAPYFLGDAMRTVDVSPRARGVTLQEEVQRSLESMWSGPLPADGAHMLEAALDGDDAGGRYDCLLLELNYIQQRYRPIPKNQAQIYHDILHISRPTHDRHLRGAVERLGARLLQQLRPVVRMEQPFLPPMLVGRQATLSQLERALQENRTVSVTGPGGVGKTSLGASLADLWPTPAVFWYTIRPTFNDQLESLLFALGYFLHRHGASTLWHQLVADGGRITDVNIALGLALGDLRSLPARALLCFDDVDFLHPPHDEDAAPRHTRLLEFLDSLRGHAAILLMGQRAFWESDEVYPLTGLSQSELDRWLTELHVPHTPADVAALYAYTGGNPRLAELCVALFEADAGDSLAAAVTQLPHSHALLPLWHRLARRLSPAERRLVQALTVFRSPAPADAWHDDGGDAHAALDQLIERRLVQQDDRGGVALLPSLREVIYAELPVETQEELHQQAAHIRAARGEYTAAAFHLLRADQPAAAVELWYPQRTAEINRGQGAAALSIFTQVSQRRLSPRLRKQLLLLRAELHELTGAAERVIDDLAHEAWPTDDPTTPDAMRRLGQAQEARGQADTALETYASGLAAVAQLLRQGTQLHVQRSMTRLRQREMDQAWREAHLALYHAETMLGVVNDQRGDYDQAGLHYNRALAIAEQIDHQAGVAQMHHYLLILATRRQGMDRVLRHGDAAIAYYERVGDRFNRECVRSNLASAYIQVGRFEEAIAPAATALRFFQAVENPFRIAQNASNLAEAHAELAQFDAAMRYAELVLQQEEPHSHPYALFTMGKVHAGRGDWPAAAHHYEQSRRVAERNDDTYLSAYAWRALGEAHAAQAHTAHAQQCLDEALLLFQRLAIDEEVRRTQELIRQIEQV